MFQALVNALFGCSHSRTTFPLTPGRKYAAAPGAVRHGTYVVCLDCGKEFGYDWNEMRVGNQVAGRVAAAPAESYSPVNR
jgi:hypothetical protein